MPVLQMVDDDSGEVDTDPSRGGWVFLLMVPGLDVAALCAPACTGTGGLTQPTATRGEGVTWPPARLTGFERWCRLHRCRSTPPVPTTPGPRMHWATPWAFGSWLVAALGDPGGGGGRRRRGAGGGVGQRADVRRTRTASSPRRPARTPSSAGRPTAGTSCPRPTCGRCCTTRRAGWSSSSTAPAPGSPTRRCRWRLASITDSVGASTAEYEGDRLARLTLDDGCTVVYGYDPTAASPGSPWPATDPTEVPGTVDGHRRARGSGARRQAVEIEQRQ